MYAPAELIAAVYGKLSSDAQLIAAVDAIRVGQLPPKLTDGTGQFRAIGITENNGAADDDKTSDGWEVEFSVDIWARLPNQTGFGPVYPLADRVYQLLHHGHDDLPLNDSDCYLMRRTNQAAMIDPDGLTSHISMRFVANLKECP